MANAAFTFPRHLRRLSCRFKRRGAPCGRAAIFFIYNSYCRFKRRARLALPGSGQSRVSASNLVAVPAYAVKLEGWGPHLQAPYRRASVP